LSAKKARNRIRFFAALPEDLCHAMPPRYFRRRRATFRRRRPGRRLAIAAPRAMPACCAIGFSPHQNTPRAAPVMPSAAASATPDFDAAFPVATARHFSRQVGGVESERRLSPTACQFRCLSFWTPSGLLHAASHAEALFHVCAVTIRHRYRKMFSRRMFHMRAVTPSRRRCRQ
jgi:hypothetical protein